MLDKQLLAKSIIILYKESMVGGTHSNIVEKIRTIVDDINTRVNNEPGITLSLDNKVINNLIYRVLDMSDIDSYDKDELLNEIEIDCDDDKTLFKYIKENISKEQTKEETTKSIISLKRSIDNHYKEKEIEKLLTKADYAVRFKRNTITDMNAFIGDLVKNLESLGGATGEVDPAITVEVDVGNSDSLTNILELAQERNTKDGILVTGWQALNRALQGGFRRGEQVLISSLQHKWKTGLTLSLFKQIALYNKPYMLDPNKKPLLIRFSSEDEIESNIQFLYQSLRYTETREPVDFSAVDKLTAAKYIQEKLQINGYTIKLFRVDPTNWSYQKLLNKCLELEAEGYEIHVCMIDYLALIPTTGCLALAGTGSDLRDMYRRVRNFMSIHKITFITPHQLNTEAKKLLRGIITEDKFAKTVAGKGYYDGCARLDMEIDVGLVGHLFPIKDNRTAYNLVVEKHRIPTVIPENRKNFYLLFPEDGMPIPDDINEEDSSYASINDLLNENNKSNDEDFLRF